jgi:integrase/recombinase XerD
MDSQADLRLEERDGGWMFAGPAASRFELVDEYLAHLVDRNYSPKTVRAYGYDLLRSAGGWLPKDSRHCWR